MYQQHNTPTPCTAHHTKRCCRPQDFTPLGARGELQSLSPDYAVRHAAMLCTAVKLDDSQARVEKGGAVVGAVACACRVRGIKGDLLSSRLYTPLSIHTSQIETSGEQGKHADFSEPRCLCWCAADDARPELIDGTTGYLATAAAAAEAATAAAVPCHAAPPQSSRFCSQAALHAFAALCGAARSAGMAPATLPAATDTAGLDAAGLPTRGDAARPHDAADAGAAPPAAPAYGSVKAGWREPEYSCARDLLLGRTIFRAWPACKQRGRG